MSRRISTKKRFPQKDFNYDNFLVSLLVNRILKKGKKQLARRIVYKALINIKEKTKENPLIILEKAIRNISPRVQLKAKRVRGATYQVPVLLTRFRSTNTAIRWIIEGSNKRGQKRMYLKLSNELLEAAKNLGHAYRKKEEIHKIANANKAFARYR
jgi:small subunit ribosomal protein S7